MQQDNPALTEGKRTDKVLREVTRSLRRMAMDSQEGDFLGSESDLLRLLEVSRPTLRQALRLLEHEQLVNIKMGPLGGCYAARPEIESVVRAAATYLQANEAPLREMISVSSTLTVHVAGLAASCADIAQREALTEFVREVDQEPWCPAPEQFSALENRFTATIRAMAANRSLDLFLQVAQRVIALNPDSHFLIEDPTVMRLRRRMWIQLAEAILSHDAQLAQQLTEQQLNLILASISPDALDKSVIPDAAPGRSQARR